MNSDSISKNFTFDEFEYSHTAEKLGLKNEIPNEEVRRAILLLVMNVLQPLRDSYGMPLFVNSGYRNLDLNKAVGGSRNSQHLRGEAADIAAEDPLLLLQLIKDNNIPFDQLIIYSNFIHISYSSSGKQRACIVYNR